MGIWISGAGTRGIWGRAQVWETEVLLGGSTEDKGMKTALEKKASQDPCRRAPGKGKEGAEEWGDALLGKWE